MIQAFIIGDAISSSSEEAFSLYEKSRFGEKRRGKVEYSLPEVIYLFEKGKLEVFSSSKKLSSEEIMKKIRKIDNKIDVKYTVFLDLREKGYIVKTALKFGAEFRVYEKGVKPGEEHARWVLFTVKEHEAMKWHDFAAKNRVAHSTKKNLLLAIVDEEGDVSYYEVAWIRP